MHRAALCTGLVLAACGLAADGERDNTGPRSDFDDPAGTLRLNDVRQKSSHNSYARHETLVDQLALHSLRSIELDIHVGKFGEPDITDDWYVYHTDVIDDRTSCRTLTDCFDSVLAYRDAVPEHEVLTIWIDLKDGWDDDHPTGALDTLARGAFGADLLTPDEVAEACPGASGLADAVGPDGCGWPTLAELRGRVMLVLTGGDIASPDTKLSRYLSQGQVAFVAPSLSTPSATSLVHPGVGIANVGLCSNPATSALGADCKVDADATATVEAAAALGHLVRVWGVDDRDSWDAAVAAGAHHLGTDFVSALHRPWAATHNEHGWPFACEEHCDEQPGAPGRVEVVVSSGDLWKEDDSFVFATRSGPAQAEWTALVAAPSSHVEDFAKGCLMARTSLEPDAAYLAVCRPADVHRARVQVREQDGASTQAIESTVVPQDTVAPDSAAYLRLVINEDRHCAHGYAALRRGEWAHLASHCFDAPLAHQGLTASSHDADEPVHFVFAGPTLNSTPVDVASLMRREVGGAEASVHSTSVP